MPQWVHSHNTIQRVYAWCSASSAIARRKCLLASLPGSKSDWKTPKRWYVIKVFRIKMMRILIISEVQFNFIRFYCCSLSSLQSQSPKFALTDPRRTAARRQRVCVCCQSGLQHRGVSAASRHVARTYNWVQRQAARQRLVAHRNHHDHCDELQRNSLIRHGCADCHCDIAPADL